MSDFAKGENIVSAQDKYAAIRKNPFCADFPLLNAKPKLAFLDSAASAQRPASVIQAQEFFYKNYNANPLRGLYELSVLATEEINKARNYTAEFIGAGSCKDAKHDYSVVFTRNATESLNIIAASFASHVLRPGDEVCISIMEHHSNIIPWQQICAKVGAKLVYMYIDSNGVISNAEMDAKIGPATKIVSIGHTSNVMGIENPVAQLGERVHANGGYLVVDGAQAIPHMKVDVRKLGADFYVFSSHKAFGPFGVGVLCGRSDLLNDMPAFLTGGEMIDSVSEQGATWAPVPEKFEAGTQDAAGIYASAQGLRCIEEIGYPQIASREALLVQYAMERLGSLGFVKIIGSPNANDHHGLISFNVEGIHPHDVSSILDMNNVAIRAGHHCAQPLLAYLGENSCCRASFAFYNDASDIDALIDGLNVVWGMFNGK